MTPYFREFSSLVEILSQFAQKDTSSKAHHSLPSKPAIPKKRARPYLISGERNCWPWLGPQPTSCNWSEMTLISWVISPHLPIYFWPFIRPCINRQWKFENHSLPGIVHEIDGCGQPKKQLGPRFQGRILDTPRKHGSDFQKKSEDSKNGNMCFFFLLIPHVQSPAFFKTKKETGVYIYIYEYIYIYICVNIDSEPC